MAILGRSIGRAFGGEKFADAAKGFDVADAAAKSLASRLATLRQRYDAAAARGVKLNKTAGAIRTASKQYDAASAKVAVMRKRMDEAADAAKGKLRESINRVAIAGTAGFAAVTVGLRSLVNAYSPAAVARFDMAMGSLSATLGQKLEPVLDAVTAQLRRLTNWVWRLPAGVTDNVVAFAKWGAVALATAGALGIVAKSVAFLLPLFAGVKAAGLLAFGALKAVAVALIPAIASIGSAVMALPAIFSAAAGGIVSAFAVVGVAMPPIGAAILAVGAAIAAVTALFPSLRRAATAAMDGIRSATERVKKAIQSVTGAFGGGTDDKRKAAEEKYAAEKRAAEEQVNAANEEHTRAAAIATAGAVAGNAEVVDAAKRAMDAAEAKRRKAQASLDAVNAKIDKDAAASDGPPQARRQAGYLSGVEEIGKAARLSAFNSQSGIDDNALAKQQVALLQALLAEQRAARNDAGRRGADALKQQERAKL